MSVLQFCVAFLLVGNASAGQPAGKQPSGPKVIPPPGVEIPAADRAELEAGTKELAGQLQNLRASLASNPALLQLLPDVELYHKAVDVALRHNEFLDLKEVGHAKKLLAAGKQRALDLAAGKHPWTTARGLVVRGYRSKLDDSVIPYGLVVPETFQPGGPKLRLDVWLHGRDEKLTELKFVEERQRSAGEFTPANTFVLHSYGRYCNAFKFAGEMDIWEALEHAKKNYPVDDQKLVMRGFSMGGAGCWHMAMHHAGVWAAAAPGAGFSETPQYTRAFANGNNPPWYEQKLWKMYDATDYAVNAFNCPTIAYSGEKDKQKQAADVMAAAMKEEGLELTHILGPDTEHKYHPEAKKQINALVDAVANKGREPFPAKVRFTTWLLRWNRMEWVNVQGLEKHWERARVEADAANGTITLKTANVSALALELPRSAFPNGKASIKIDSASMEVPLSAGDPATVRLEKTAGAWTRVDAFEPGLRKRPGLQGPIDDAFMDSFLFVRPTGAAANEAAGKWVQSELERAIKMWRSQFRGDVRIKDDSAVTAEDIAHHNLILWGDPSSNAVLKKIADKLPIGWTATELAFGAEKYPAAQHVLIAIAPNPLNPAKYVVLNSGFTFREDAMTSNARQIPMLPDYALIDLSEPPSRKYPGKIVRAGFFSETWQLQPNDGK